MTKPITNDLGLTFIPNKDSSSVERALQLFPYTVCLLLEASKIGYKESEVLRALEKTLPIDRRAIASAYSFYLSNPDAYLQRFQLMAKVAVAVKNSFAPQPVFLDNILESVATRIGFVYVPDFKSQFTASNLSRPSWATAELDAIWLKPPTGVIGWIHIPTDIVMLQIIDHNRQPAEDIRIFSQKELKEQMEGHIQSLIDKMNQKLGDERRRSI